MSTTPAHTLTNGDLSAYALALGYVQSLTIGPVIPDPIRRRVEDEYNRGRALPPSRATTARYEVRLSFNGCTYDVKRRDNEHICRETTIWEQYDTASEARAAFRRMVRASR